MHPNYYFKRENQTLFSLFIFHNDTVTFVSPFFFFFLSLLCQLSGIYTALPHRHNVINGSKNPTKSYLTPSVANVWVVLTESSNPSFTGRKCFRACFKHPVFQKLVR